jgi:hypothetical protein
MHGKIVSAQKVNSKNNLKSQKLKKQNDHTPKDKMVLQIQGSKEQHNNDSCNIETISHFSENNEEKMQYLEGIVSKQLELYTWCEEKVNTLATIDSILLGAATFFIEHVKVVSKSPNPWIIPINIAMISVLLLPISISLVITLWHIRPKMRSGAIPQKRPNHRSVAGISKFENATRYREHLDRLTISEICEDLTNQIYGMNKNIWRNQRSIKTAVFFDIIGLIGFILILFYLTIAK